jgi:hypothetical protein
MMKKKLLLVALIMLSVFAADAQVSSPGGYDWRDSSVVPPARMEQHFEFMNNQYNFPAQPRSQWELGIKLGAPTVSGDVDASFLDSDSGFMPEKHWDTYFQLEVSTHMEMLAVLGQHILRCRLFSILPGPGIQTEISTTTTKPVYMNFLCRE